MLSLAAYFNASVGTWSLFWTQPHYPLANSLSTLTVNMWDLPPLVAEKVALLKLVEVEDTVSEVGTRTGEHNFVVYLPDGYQIKGLEV